MHFIIPKNYQFKPKLLGIIDIKTAILDSILAILIYYFINLFYIKTLTKIYIFIALFLPFFLFTIIGINNENSIAICLYIFKYYLKQKIYLFERH